MATAPATDTTTPVTPATASSDALLQFMNKESGITPKVDTQTPPPAVSENQNVIIEGKKISNAALREFVYMYRHGKNMSDHDILELFMGLDEAIESQKLTNPMLDEIKKDPAVLN